MRPLQVQPADFLEVHVDWSDATLYGATLSGRGQAFVREGLYPRTTRRLLAAGVPTGRGVPLGRELAALALSERGQEAHRRLLEHEGFWYPDEQAVAPATAQLRCTLTGSHLSLPLGEDGTSVLRRALREGAAEAPRLLQHQLETTAAAVRATAFRRLAPPHAALGRQALFVGHGCVSLSDGELRLWSDPFLRPKSPRYPPHHQPLSPFDLPESSHAVLLTHTHLDHFDPGSLFWFPEDTLFLVPAVERESLLSLNVRLRLAQLGFRSVRELRWGESVKVGTFEVLALPFYGEQPLGGGAETTLPEFNRGNTYGIRERSGRTLLLLADSGSDPRRTSLQNARHVRRELGPVDVLFANHRRWRLYPPQFLTSSVPHYLCYVPDEELGMPQQLMMEPQELAAVAEVLQARRVVPYAMGGASWYEEIGLGYDSFSTRRRSTAFDANPRELADRPMHGESRIVLLHAGQVLSARGSPRWLPGLRRPDRRRLLPARKARSPLCWAITGPGVTQALLRDLLAITRLDRRAFFLAGPGLCEVYTSPDRPGALVRAVLTTLDLSGENLLMLWHSVPFTASAFLHARHLHEDFRALHAEAFRPLKHGGDVVGTLQKLASRPPFAGLPPLLVERLRRSVLKEKPGATARSRFVREHGAARTDAALLLVKLVHNLYLTCDGLGIEGVPPNEMSWFRALRCPHFRRLPKRSRVPR